MNLFLLKKRDVGLFPLFVFITVILLSKVASGSSETDQEDSNQNNNLNGITSDDQNGMQPESEVYHHTQGSFVPTKNWKTIQEGQKVPAGLHIRVNLETGHKEAKLIDEKLDSESAIEGSNDMMEIPEKYDVKPKMQPSQNEKFLKQDILDALKNIKSEDNLTPEENVKESSRRKNLFRSYEDLKAEFKELNMNIESDMEILNRLIAEYRTLTDDELKVNILEDLEYLSHQIDNAVYFVDMGGIQHVIQPGLNSSNEDIRKGVLQLLGSASQSNPKVQIAALEEGLLSQLLRIVSREKDISVSSKAVFAVSCLVRGFPFGQQRLIETGGLNTLREIFQKQDWKSLNVQLKVVSLIQDLLEEREGAEGERAIQLSKVNLQESLVRGEWCPAVSSLLSAASFDKRGIRHDMGSALGIDVPLRPDHDMVDKIISAMVLLASSCKQYFTPDLLLLQTLEETYSDLAYKEQFQGEDGHALFGEIATRIQRLVRTINFRDEL